MKKAMELSILCCCDVSLLVVSDNKLYEYSSKNLSEVFQSYDSLEKMHDSLTNADYDTQFGTAKGKKKKENQTQNLSASQPQPQRVPAPSSHFQGLHAPSSHTVFNQTSQIPQIQQYQQQHQHQPQQSHQHTQHQSNLEMQRSPNHPYQQQQVQHQPPPQPQPPRLDRIANMHSITSRNRSLATSSEDTNALTPKTAQKYRMANKKYEDLLSNINSDPSSLRNPNYNQSNNLFPSVTGRPVPETLRRSSEGDTTGSSGFPRKRQRFDTKKLTIKVPRYTNKEARAPVPVDEQTHRNSIPQLSDSNASGSDAAFENQAFPSMTPTLNILDCDLTLGLSPLPMTPSSSVVPYWPWTPTPKPNNGSDFRNFGIEQPHRMHRF